MAKELPYFKFEPNAWENGNIQMLSREDKGLFIDLCSMYWSRLGDLPKKLAVQKLCAGNATALNSLCEENIIEVIEGNIYIKFLTIQLDEFENTSSKNSENAKKRWEKHREQKVSSERNATALNPHCETDAIREEERREEKMKEDNKPPAASKPFTQFSKDDFHLEVKPFVAKYGKQTCRDFFHYWTQPNGKGKMRFQLEKTWSVPYRLATWKRNEEKFGNTEVPKQQTKVIPGPWNV